VYWQKLAGNKIKKAGLLQDKKSLRLAASWL